MSARTVLRAEGLGGGRVRSKNREGINTLKDNDDSASYTSVGLDTMSRAPLAGDNYLPCANRNFTTSAYALRYPSTLVACIPSFLIWYLPATKKEGVPRTPNSFTAFS